MSDCDLFRADLNAYRDDALDQARKEQLRGHLQHCHDCTEEVRQLDLMESEIRIRAEQWVAPVELWERVQNSVESRNMQKPLLHSITHKPLAWIAAAMLLATVAVAFLQLPSSSNSVAAVLVNEFHTFVVSRRQLDYSNSQATAIRQWFADKVEFRAPMPIQPVGLQLAGGRLCNMLDQRVASYMYQIDGTWVSLYILKSKSLTGEGLSDQVMLRGYGYMEWENDGLHYSLVGDISGERLGQIAKTIYLRQLSAQPLQSYLLPEILVLSIAEKLARNT